MLVLKQRHADLSRRTEGGGSYLESASDLMIGLLFIFIILVVVLALEQRRQIERRAWPRTREHGHGLNQVGHLRKVWKALGQTSHGPDTRRRTDRAHFGKLAEVSQEAACSALLAPLVECERPFNFLPVEQSDVKPLVRRLFDRCVLSLDLQRRDASGRSRLG